MYTYKYPHPAITADCVVLAFDGKDIRVLLIERKNNPYAGCWAFPGGFMEIDEAVEESARRELIEETGFPCDCFEQFHVFSKVDRDERERVVTVAFLALLPYLPEVKAADDAKRAEWHKLSELPALAFDHKEIIEEAQTVLRKRARLEPVLFKLLPSSFKMEDLKTVYEQVHRVNMGNEEFKAKMDRLDFLDHNADATYSLNADRYNKYVQELMNAIF